MTVRTWLHGLSGILGLWLIVAPFVLGFAAASMSNWDNATWSSFVGGILVLFVAIVGWFYEDRAVAMARGQTKA